MKDENFKNLKHTVVLMRSLRTESGWIRRKVTPGKSRNWEQRIDHDRKHFGADVLDLGSYQIRRYENGKTRYEPGGDTYTQAVAVYNRRINRVALLSAAKTAGVELAPEETETAALPEQMEEFCNARAATGKHTAPATRESYRLALRDFVSITRVRRARDVKAATLVAYLAGLRRLGLNPQTIASRYISVGAILRYADKNLTGLLLEYKPPVPRRKKVSYSEEELEAFLTFLRGRPRQYAKLALVAETYFKTGLRNKELAYLTWDVVDLNKGFIRNLDNRELSVRTPGGRVEKFLYRTKARRDREVSIPLADGLLGRLREWRESHPRDRFVFPTRNGNPDHAFRTKIRTAICHAGMNCRACDVCLVPCGRCRHCRCKKCDKCRKRLKCSRPHHGNQPCTRIECRKWKIHNFRHSFITLALHGGIDPGTVKDIAGHADLRTTNGYLSTIAEGKAREKINQVFASAFGD